MTSARGVLLRPPGDVVGLTTMVTSTTEEIDRAAAAWEGSIDEVSTGVAFG